MSRRLLAALAAVVLAVIAAVLVISYVNAADERAMADMEPETVLMVTESIPQGTRVEEMGDFVATDELPAAAVVPEGIDSLEDVAGQVSTAPLYPGEQLVAGRFSLPEDLEDAREVEVPEEHHEITVQLPTTRVIGGNLTAGDTVGFFVTSDGQTQLALQKVLVTRVLGGVTETVAEDGTETTTPAAESLMVTLAVEVGDAKTVANAAEGLGIWLSLETEDDPADDSGPVTTEDAFE